ncbi:MAG: hypothetical protein ACFB2X_12815 [Rivularia sp. (in: cyanobacteria)]
MPRWLKPQVAFFLPALKRLGHPYYRTFLMIRFTKPGGLVVVSTRKSYYDTALRGTPRQKQDQTC